MRSSDRPEYVLYSLDGSALLAAALDELTSARERIRATDRLLSAFGERYPECYTEVAKLKHALWTRAGTVQPDTHEQQPGGRRV